MLIEQKFIHELEPQIEHLLEILLFDEMMIIIIDLIDIFEKQFGKI